MHGETVAEMVHAKFGFIPLRADMPLVVGQVIGGDESPRPGIPARRTRLVVIGTSTVEEYSEIKKYADEVAGVEKPPPADRVFGGRAGVIVAPPPQHFFYYRCDAVKEATVQKFVMPRG